MKSIAGEGRLFIQKNRIITGMLLIATAIALIFVLYPRIIESRSKTFTVLCVTRAVEAGSILQATDLTERETSDAALAKLLFTNSADAVGKAAVHDLAADSYLFLNDLSDAFIVPTIYNTIPEGLLLISLSVPSPAQSVAGQLRAKDIVRLYSINDQGVAYTPKELQYVKLIAVYNSSGTELDHRKQPSGSSGSVSPPAIAGNTKDTSDTREIPAMLSMLVTQNQALRIVELEKSGMIFFSLVSRDDETESERLLALQQTALSVSGGGGLR